MSNSSNFGNANAMRNKEKHANCLTKKAFKVWALDWNWNSEENWSNHRIICNENVEFSWEFLAFSIFWTDFPNKNRFSNEIALKPSNFTEFQTKNHGKFTEEPSVLCLKTTLCVWLRPSRRNNRIGADNGKSRNCLYATFYLMIKLWFKWCVLCCSIPFYSVPFGLSREHWLSVRSTYNFYGVKLKALAFQFRMHSIALRHGSIGSMQMRHPCTNGCSECRDVGSA